ncbi:MAG: oligosaccharide flippase family protein [Desulfobulbaceae bacterium]|nr:oligosaccharide flippase family protein [Desulfobulbaceae bacterium]
MGLGIIVSAVKYPLYLHFLGYEHYGAWLLLSTVLTFAQMGLLGIAPAITKLVAEEFEQNNTQAIQQYFTTALWMLVAVGAILLGVSIIFKWQIISLMGLTGDNAVIIDGLFIYMLIFSIGILAYQILNSVISGVGRIDIANYSQTVLQVLPLLISVPLLIRGIGVISLLLANAFAYLVVFWLNLIRVNKITSLRLTAITAFSGTKLRKMLTFGTSIFAGSILNMMVVPLTKIIITRHIGLEGVPVFEVAYRLSMQVRGIFEVAFRALMPEVSRVLTSGCHESILKVKKTIQKSYRLLATGVLPIYFAVFLFADIIFKIWLGSNYAETVVDVFRILLAESFVNILAVVSYHIFIGASETFIIFIYRIIDVAVKLFAITLFILISSSLLLTHIAWCFVVGSIASTSFLLASYYLYNKNNKYYKLHTKQT